MGNFNLPELADDGREPDVESLNGGDALAPLASPQFNANPSLADLTKQQVSGRIAGPSVPMLPPEQLAQMRAAQAKLAPEAPPAREMQSFHRGEPTGMSPSLRMPGTGLAMSDVDRARSMLGMNVDAKYQTPIDQADAKARQEQVAAMGDTQKAMEARNQAAQERYLQTSANNAADAKYQQDHAHLLASKVADVDKAIGDYRGMKVDPDHIWKEKGTLAKIGAAIAQGLGAYASAITHSPNYAQEIVQTAINRDIEAQRANIEKAKGNIDQQQGLYSMLREQGLDHDAAAARTRAEGFEQYKTKLAEIGQTSNDQQVLRNVGTQIALADKQIAQDKKQEQVGLQRTVYQIQMQRAAQAAAQQAAAVRQQQEMDKEGRKFAQDVALEKVKQEGKTTKAESAEKYSAARDAAGVPTFEANISEADRLMNEGAPGTGIITRHLPQGLQSSGARQLHGRLMGIAEAYAHASGQRSPEAIHLNYDSLFGNGSEADIRAGLAQARKVIGARAANIDAGTSDDVKDLYESRSKPAGFEPDQ